MTNIELYGTQVIPRVRELLAEETAHRLTLNGPGGDRENRSHLSR